MPIDPKNLSKTAHVTFSDDFNDLSLWNGHSGAWSSTFWYQDDNSNGASLPGNGEQEWYINAQYGPTAGVKPWTTSNGVLTLQATPTPSNLSGHVNNYAYVSGELNTYHSFSQTYGYFEMRAQLPKGQGFWPAFWLMPENGAWPPELDVMEVIGSDTTMLGTTVHSIAGGNYVKHGKANYVSDTSAGYHTYGVDWEPDTITWYFDGDAIYQTATPADMHNPMYMIANLAVGGYWPGPADGYSSARMNIDYIRAYAPGAASQNDQPAPPPAPTPAPPQAAQPAQPASAPVTDNGASSTAGVTIHSDNNRNTVAGGFGNDVFHLGRGGDTATGGAGADTFAYAETPWAQGRITDFHADQGDVVDVTGLLHRSGYTSSDPFADGYLKLTADAAGDAQLWSNIRMPGNDGWWLVATFDHVATSSLHYSGGLLT